MVTKNLEYGCFVTGYDVRYIITSLGRLYSNVSDRWLNPNVDSSGYIQYRLTRNGKARSVLAHRLVAQHFIDNPFDLETVNHIDGNKLNNKVNNLEWMSVADNIKHGQQIDGELINPEGTLVKFKGVAEFARLNNLDPSHVSKLLRGEANTCKGWTRNG